MASYLSLSFKGGEMDTLTRILDAYVWLYSEVPSLFAGCMAIIGLFIGSFLNVVAIRVPEGESVIFPPSRCANCSRRLKAWDLIPVVSYFILRGKCRSCGAAFSPKYAVYEALTGLLYGLSAWHFGLSWELAAALAFVSILVVIVQTDMAAMMIPDRVLLVGIIVIGMLRIFIHPLALWNYTAAFFIGGGLLYAIALFSERVLGKEGMGGGDIKLFSLIGLMLGINLTLLTLFLASLIGTLFGGVQMLIGVYRRDRAIPFGPFIAVGAYVSYLYGQAVIDWYVSFLRS
jgi:leader peptidase (prepilin peptidase)/N-methyltransferase